MRKVLAVLAVLGVAGCTAAYAAPAAPPSCRPSGHWQCPPPSPVPTVTSPSPSPTSTSTSPGPTPTPTRAWTCTVTGDNTSCPAAGYYNDFPGIVPSNGWNTYIANNCFSACPAQVLNANDGTDWQVTATEPAGDTSVEVGPELQQQTDDWCNDPGANNWATIVTTCQNQGPVPVSALASWTSSYAESMPHNSQTVAEAAYDIWQNNYPSDVMIWVDTVGRCEPGAFGGTTLGTGLTIGGQAYDAYRYGGPGAEIIFVLEGPGGAGTCAQQPAGTVDILGVLSWLAARGYVSNVTVPLVDFTFEICSTGGVPETFAVTSYTMAAAP